MTIDLLTCISARNVLNSSSMFSTTNTPHTGTVQHL